MKKGYDIGKTKHLLKVLVENMQDLVTIVDEQTHIVFASTSHKKLGYKEDELNSKVAFDFVHNSDRREVEKQFSRLKNVGDELNVEFRFRKKDGEYIWIESIGKKIDDKIFLFNSRDISERKKYEADITNEELFISSIIENSFEIISISDGKGILKLETGAVNKILGYDRNERVGINVFETIYPQDKEKIEKIFFEFISSDEKVKTVEYRAKHKSGKWIWLESIGQNFLNDPIINGVLVNSHDITQRKEAEEEVLTRSKIFEQFFNLPINLQLVAGLEGTIYKTNAGVKSILGYEVEYFSGKNFLDFIHPDDIEATMEELKNLEKGKVTFYFENRYKKEDGEWATIAWTAFVAKEDNLIYASGKDITEQRRETLERLNREKEMLFSQSFARLGTWSLNLATDEVTWTEELYKMYGFDPKLPPPQYHTQKKLFTDESWDLLTRELAKTAEEGIPYELELNTIRKDGSKGWMWVYGEAIKDEKGKIIELRGAAQDISERKETEKKLSETNEQLAFALSSAKLGIWILNFENNELYWSNETYKMFDLTPEEFIPDFEAFASFVNPEDVNYMREEFDKAIKKITPLYHAIVRIKNESGKEWVMEAYGKVKTNEKGEVVSILGTAQDVSERISEKKALKDSEERFEALHNASFGGIVIHDKGLILECNQGLSNITGYTYDELIGMNGLLLINDETRPQVIKNIQDGYELPYEAVGSRKDGSEYPIRLEARMIPYKGKTVRVVEFRDMTDIKKTEKDLRMSENLKAKMVANLGDVIIIIDADGFITYISSNIKNLFGWNAEKFIGAKFCKYMHPEDHDKIYYFLNHLTEGEKEIDSIELRFQNEQGEFRWIQFTGNNLLDDKDINGVLGNFHDITERIKNKQILKESEEKHRRMIHSIEAAVVIHAPDTSITFANNKAVELLGLELDEMMGKKAIDPNWYFLNEDGEKYELKDYPVYKVLNTGEGFEGMVIGINRPVKKDICWVLVNAFPEKDSAGQISEIVVTFINITARKNAEQAVIETQRLGAIGEMSSAVAHDFNNSLQSIFGNLDIAMIRLGDNHPAYQNLETIRTASEDAANRIKMLQRFSGKSKSKKDYKPVDVNNLLDEVILQARPIWKDKAEQAGTKIEIIRNYSDDIFTFGNSAELRSVFFNIIKNGCEAISKSGVIKIETGYLGEDEKGTRKIFVRVSDTGCGIPEKNRAKIFQPFFSTKGFEAGRGMGLAGAYTVIKEHSGDIFIRETKSDEGTQFEINLPYKKFEGLQDEKLSKGCGENKGWNLLWVDDDEMIRETLPSILEIIGLEGEIAGSGFEALEKLRKKKFNLVVTDIGMPGMNGWELIENIQKEEIKVKILVTTGWGNEITDEQSGKYNIEGIISKPFKMKAIKKIICELIKKS